MAQTTDHRSPRTRAPLGWLLAFGIGLAITIGVGLALISARNKPADPTWEYLGETRDCTEIPMISETMFNSWEAQCR